MKTKFYRRIKKLMLPIMVFFVSCSGVLSPDSGKSEKLEELSIANWNVQTFFDSTTDGCEYEQFISSRTWGVESYTERLKRLADAIKSLDADLVIMEELENEGVLHDISNFLAGEWNQKKNYRYACFAKEEDSSIGCGILSRYPLENLTLHSMDIRTDSEMPKMRPLMQVTVCKDEKKLALFVNHWKSMSGGEEETEQWRLWQESILSHRIRQTEVSLPVIACGDFNRDIESFKKGQKRDQILLRQNPDEDCKNGVLVLSPWFDESQNLIEPGSYFFDGEWSRIDNFFVAGSADIADFHPVTNGPWCDENTSVPIKYQIWNGKGYSDHLPIFCRVSF